MLNIFIFIFFVQLNKCKNVAFLYIIHLKTVKYNKFLFVFATSQEI